MSARPVHLTLALLLSSGAANAAGVLTARCTPAVVTRAEEVTCSVSVEGASFIVTGRRSVAFGHAYSETLNEPHAPGESSSWTGPAIVPTWVQFTASVNGAAQTASARYMVRPRALPRVLLRDDQFKCKIDTKGAVLPDPPYKVPGASEDRPLPADGIFSNAHLVIPPPDWDLADRGPDTDWYYVSAPVLKPVQLQILLSHALEPESDFFRAQHSSRSLPSKAGALAPTCRRSALAALRQQIWESEGCAGALTNSRVRLIQKLLKESLDINGLIEDLTQPLRSATGKKNPFVERVNARMRELGDNALLDDTALPPPPTLRCQLRFPAEK